MFQTTLYNSQIDLQEYPHKGSDQSLSLQAEIHWRTYIKLSGAGFSIAARCTLIDLQVEVLDEHDIVKDGDVINIKGDEWDVDINLGTIKLGGFVMPNSLVVNYRSKTVTVGITENIHDELKIYSLG